MANITRANRYLRKAATEKLNSIPPQPLYLNSEQNIPSNQDQGSNVNNVERKKPYTLQFKESCGDTVVSLVNALLEILVKSNCDCSLHHSSQNEQNEIIDEQNTDIHHTCGFKIDENLLLTLIPDNNDFQTISDSFHEHQAIGSQVGNKNHVENYQDDNINDDKCLEPPKKRKKYQKPINLDST